VPRILERGVRGFEQIGLRIHAGERGGLDEGMAERGDLGAALGPGAVVVLAVHDHAAEPPPRRLRSVTIR